MGRGLPDYYRIQRVVEGALQVFLKSGSAPSGTYEWDVTTGRGIVLGGHLNASRKNAYFGISIDGGSYITLTFEAAESVSVDKEWSALFYLIQYDELNSKFTFGLSRRFTFEESLKVKFYAPTTFTTYNVRIYYAKIL